MILMCAGQYTTFYVFIPSCTHNPFFANIWFLDGPPHPQEPPYQVGLRWNSHTGLPDLFTERAAALRVLRGAELSRRAYELT